MANEVLQYKLKHLKECEFDLNMKDRWTSADSYKMDQYRREIREIEQKLKEEEEAANAN